MSQTGWCSRAGRPPAASRRTSSPRSGLTPHSEALTPPRLMSLEDMMAYIDSDELLEVTPQSLRLRKRYLLEHERKKYRRQLEEEQAIAS